MASRCVQGPWCAPTSRPPAAGRRASSRGRFVASCASRSCGVRGGKYARGVANRGCGMPSWDAVICGYCGERRDHFMGLMGESQDRRGLRRGRAGACRRPGEGAQRNGKQGLAHHFTQRHQKKDRSRRMWVWASLRSDEAPRGPRRRRSSPAQHPIRARGLRPRQLRSAPNKPGRATPPLPPQTATATSTTPGADAQRIC